MQVSIRERLPKMSKLHVCLRSHVNRQFRVILSNASCHGDEDVRVIEVGAKIINIQ